MVVEIMKVMQIIKVLVPMAAFQHDIASQSHTGENGNPAHMKDVL